MPEQACMDTAKQKIGDVFSGAVNEIKPIVLEEIQKLGERFPEMIFGVRDEKPRKSNVVHGMLGVVDVTVRAVATKMSGIVLSKDDRFWTEASIIVLTPEGIFKCGYVMSEPADRESRIRDRHCVQVNSQPDWKYREESPNLWVQYCEAAIHKLSLVK